LTSADANTFLTTMFLRHISNRACKTVIYSCLIGQYNFPHVTQVPHIGKLPTANVQLVIALGGENASSIKDYIKKLPPTVHLICIEQPMKLVKNEHILMLAVGTDPDDDG
uniref:SAM-dependent MTase TRM10-type domain-containing protein n=1 Tax=Gongylonema pulchrum TaxID=637853 RepID=A0A183EYN3_9BILA